MQREYLMLLSDELWKIVAYTKYLPNCDTKPLFKPFFSPHFIVLAGGQIFPAPRELKNKQIGFHVWFKFGLIYMMNFCSKT